MNSHIVCLCLTTYPKRADMLRDALHAFTLQTYPDRTLVVVNDGAPLRAVSPAFSVDVLNCTPGTTIGAKRQQGLAYAGAAWVSTWDDDDFFLPNHLTSMAHTARVEGALVVRNRLHALVNEHLKVASIVRRPAPAGVLFWGPAAQAVGGYHDQPYGEDWSLYVRLQLAQTPTRLSAELTYLHRRHTGNISRGFESPVWSSDRQTAEGIEDQQRWPRHELITLQRNLDRCLAVRRSVLVEPA